MTPGDAAGRPRVAFVTLDSWDALVALWPLRARSAGEAGRTRGPGRADAAGSASRAGRSLQPGCTRGPWRPGRARIALRPDDRPGQRRLLRLAIRRRGDDAEIAIALRTCLDGGGRRGGDRGRGEACRSRDGADRADDKDD